MPVTFTLLFAANIENLPASAPTSRTKLVFDRLIDFEINSVSIDVKYFPKRVLAAFSQCVS